jgi:hypothetical protein
MAAACSPTRHELGEVDEVANANSLQVILLGFASIRATGLGVCFLTTISDQRICSLQFDVYNETKWLCFLDEAKAPLDAVKVSIEFGHVEMLDWKV